MDFSDKATAAEVILPLFFYLDLAVGSRNVLRYGVCQGVYVPGLDDDLAGSVEFVHQAFAGHEPEGAGSHADVVIQGCFPSDHVLVVDGHRCVWGDVQNNQVTEGVDQNLTVTFRFHHEEPTGAAKEGFADILALDVVEYGIIAGQECAGVQTVLISAAHVEARYLSGYGRCDAQPGTFRLTDCFCDEHAFAAHRTAGKRAHQSAKTGLFAVGFRLKAHVLHKCHSAPLHLDGFAGAESDIHDWRIRVADNFMMLGSKAP